MIPKDSFETRIIVKSDQGSYDVHIGAGIVDGLFESQLQTFLSRKIILVTDQHVNQLYTEKFEQLFNNASSGNFKVELSACETVRMWSCKPESESESEEVSEYDEPRIHPERPLIWYKCVVPAGEDSKSMGCMTEILELMASLKMNRSDVLIAFGGGVVGDLAGYVASSYMRGIDYVQVPTTLLSMIDSSVGGKVAVNLRGGKNLAGAFYSPVKVIADLSYLKTLDTREFRSGLGEVVKYGMISDASILDDCDSEINLIGLVSKCVLAKASIVEKDEYESHIRMILNYGHTFGHAVEAFYGYHRYSHGEAVAIGMVLIEYFDQWYHDGLNVDLSSFAERRTRLKALLLKLGLPVANEMLQKLPLREMKPFVLADKKSDAEGINMVFVESPGHGVVRKIEYSKIKFFMDNWEAIFEKIENAENAKPVENTR